MARYAFNPDADFGQHPFAVNVYLAASETGVQVLPKLDRNIMIVDLWGDTANVSIDTTSDGTGTDLGIGSVVSAGSIVYAHNGEAAANHFGFAYVLLPTGA